jgi:hypothetical protein
VVTLIFFDVVKSSLFDVAVLVDALGSSVNRCASMYGAALCAIWRCLCVLSSVVL